MSPPALLDEPEHEVLLRLSRLVQRLFHVPAAYMALLGPDLAIITRIGTGTEHWDDLDTFPLDLALAGPTNWLDASGIAVPGFTSGDVRFAASAPLRSSDGLEVGLLVIADTEPRPEFSPGELETLAGLAGVLAGKMELRMMLSQARETELSLKEAERRFRNIANAAPVLIHLQRTGRSQFLRQQSLAGLYRQDPRGRAGRRLRRNVPSRLSRRRHAKILGCV